MISVWLVAVPLEKRHLRYSPPYFWGNEWERRGRIPSLGTSRLWRLIPPRQKVVSRYKDGETYRSLYRPDNWLSYLLVTFRIVKIRNIGVFSSQQVTAYEPESQTGLVSPSPASLLSHSTGPPGDRSPRQDILRQTFEKCSRTRKSSPTYTRIDGYLESSKCPF